MNKKQININMPKLFRKFDRNEFLVPFDTIFDNFFKDAFPNISNEIGINYFEKHSFPKVDIIDYGDRIEIEANIAGLSKDEISVTIDDNVLVISGHSKKKEPKNYIRKELKYSDFKRSFTLDDTVNTEDLNATFKNGLLIVSIKKFKSSKTHRKEIKIQ